MRTPPAAILARLGAIRLLASLVVITALTVALGSGFPLRWVMNAAPVNVGGEIQDSIDLCYIVSAKHTSAPGQVTIVRIDARLHLACIYDFEGYGDIAFPGQLPVRYSQLAITPGEMQGLMKDMEQLHALEKQWLIYDDNSDQFPVAFSQCTVFLASHEESSWDESLAMPLSGPARNYSVADCYRWECYYLVNNLRSRPETGWPCNATSKDVRLLRRVAPLLSSCLKGRRADPSRDALDLEWLPQLQDASTRCFRSYSAMNALRRSLLCMGLKDYEYLVSSLVVPLDIEPQDRLIKAAKVRAQKEPMATWP